MNEIKTALDISEQLKREALERQANPKVVWGIPTGFRGLDYKTGGMHKEAMTVLMARPGVGKSVILGQIAFHVAQYIQEQGIKGVARVVSCEMSAEAFTQRTVCAISGVPSHKIRSGRASPEQLNRYNLAADSLNTLPIEFLDSPRSLEDTGKWLAQRAMPTVWFGIDYLQIHPVHSTHSNPSDYQIGTMVSNFFRRVTRSIAPGMLLSQMSRDVEKREDKRPIMADLRSSGAIEQDASVVLGLYREDVYVKLEESEELQPKPAELIIRKNRFGPCGTVPLIWNPPAVQFIDASAVYDELEVV